MIQFISLLKRNITGIQKPFCFFFFEECILADFRIAMLLKDIVCVTQSYKSACIVQ